MDELTSKDRRALRARAHRLDPVVIVGGEGLTDAVVAEIDRNLTAHELIKVRVAEAERDERDEIMEAICGRTGCAPVQHIGKILVVYRPAPAPEEKPAPRPARKPAASRKPARKAEGREPYSAFARPGRPRRPTTRTRKDPGTGKAAPRRARFGR
jgi:RNA-binding protein